MKIVIQHECYYILNYAMNFNEEKEEEPKNNAPEIDDEGYCIQPSGQWTVDKEETFASSSDSDEERDTRLHEIKSLSNGVGPISASVDEFRATVENIIITMRNTYFKGDLFFFYVGDAQ